MKITVSKPTAFRLGEKKTVVRPHQRVSIADTLGKRLAKVWRQTRLYTCPRCGMQYRHDHGHHHAVFTCPQRPRTPKQSLEHFLKTGRTYCPATEKDR